MFTYLHVLQHTVSMPSQALTVQAQPVLQPSSHTLLAQPWKPANRLFDGPDAASLHTSACY